MQNNCTSNNRYANLQVNRLTSWDGWDGLKESLDYITTHSKALSNPVRQTYNDNDFQRAIKSIAGLAEKEHKYRKWEKQALETIEKENQRFAGILLMNEKLSNEFYVIGVEAKRFADLSNDWLDLKLALIEAKKNLNVASWNRNFDHFCKRTPQKYRK